ncbi:unnamed protein product [Tetraodon nigroviridis]|nr:unnamed protein product [Tetraodon nigroviridis]
MKELQTLMNRNGFDFLTPVVGFYCQRCEEFFGDWTSAEDHAAIHCCTCSSEVRLDKCAGGGEMHSRHPTRDGRDGRPSHKKDPRDSSCHSNPGEPLADRDWGEERDRRGRHPAATGRKESLFFEEEMKKERMLITVSQGPEPPSHISLHKDLQSVPSGKTTKTKSQKKKKKKKREGIG